MVAKPSLYGPSGRPLWWDRVLYGSLVELPWARRRPIMRAVKAGVVVVDSVDAAVIARFADWLARRLVVWAAVCATAVAVCAAELAVDGLQFPELYGIAGIVWIAASVRRVKRCRRVRAQALAALPAPNG